LDHPLQRRAQPLLRLRPGPANWKLDYRAAIGVLPWGGLAGSSTATARLHAAASNFAASAPM
jgi:hypothetical protein